MGQLQLSESSQRFDRMSHTIGYSLWKFEWCPKYRYKMFRQWKYKKLAEACIRYAATRWNIKIFELEVQPEHVHITVKIPLTMTPSSALHKLRGISSKKLFDNVPNFAKRYPKKNFWGKGKVATSLGMITVEAANEYVRSQDEHHETTWIIED